MKDKKDILDNAVDSSAASTASGSGEYEEPGVLVLGEDEAEASESDTRHTRYMPRFTEASEKHRRKGDAKIRERLGLKNQPEAETEENPDEIKLDPTAEFDTDFEGSLDAREPENVAVDESDESISVYKFASPEEELEAEAEKEREEIKKLLSTDKPKIEPIAEEPEAEEPAVEEPVVEEPEEEVKEYTLPDPGKDDFGVYDFTDKGSESKKTAAPAPTAAKGGKKKRAEKEFNNPTQRDTFKDHFLDSLISIKIRTVAALVFTAVMLVLEILGAVRVIPSSLIANSDSHFYLGLVDFLLATCIFLMLIPEMFKAVKHLFGKRVLPDILPLPAYLLLGIHTLTVYLTNEKSYILFGLLFATTAIPVFVASLYRTKADFIAFKKVSALEEKQVIDIHNTRELEVENKALDGVIDEYKSKLVSSFDASFISDFFKNTKGVITSPKHIAIIFGIPFGAALVAGIIAFFLSWSFVTAVEVLCFVAMIGSPACAILASKLSYFYSQRAALLTDSTAIGEDAYEKYAAADVFTFEDTDIFGQDDVNLKRFMLYGDRSNMDNIMRQMCALFAAVGGPLDGMFSEIIDNRVRHKTASNIIIEDDGICGDVAGHQICVGSEDYMYRNGIAIPSAAVVRDSGMSFDTIRVMYAAEDGEVNAKFYIRYSFSEEFTMIIPSLREAGIVPLVYTRDPNITTELLTTLTAGSGDMRVVKLYNPVDEKVVAPRADARMITYGDKLDAAGMIVLAKKNSSFSIHMRFTELCAMGFGLVMALGLSIFGLGGFTPIIASLWQILGCLFLGFVTKSVFLKEKKKKKDEY